MAIVQLLPQIRTVHPASVEILKMVRAEALPWLRLLLGLFCVFQLLSFDLSPAKGETRWVAFRHSMHLATLQAMEVLFNKTPVPISRRERWQSAGIALCFAGLFLILLAKNLVTSKASRISISINPSWITPSTGERQCSPLAETFCIISAYRCRSILIFHQ